MALLVGDAADRAPHVSSPDEPGAAERHDTDPATPGRGMGWAAGARVGAAAFLALVAVLAVVWRARRRGRDRESGQRPPDDSLAWRLQWLRYRLGTSVGPMDVAGVLSALRRPPVPRVVPFISIKRTDTRLGRSYGHWWVELDGAESYGWWPRRCPVRLRHLLFGTAGTLNGLASSCLGGGMTLDPHHLDPAEVCLHPTLVARKSDRRLRADIRAFAHTYRGEWRWSVRSPAQNCRSFQLALMDAVGLSEGDAPGSTRGGGCPLLRPLRQVRQALRNR